MRELEGWGVARSVHVLRDRREHFEAIGDVWQMLSILAEARKRREVDPTLAILRECAAQSKAGAGGTDRFIEKRIHAMLDVFEALSRLVEEFVKLPTAAIRGIAGLQGRLRSVFRVAKYILRTLFSFYGTIDRRAYITVALAGVLLKHIIDLSFATFIFHRPWSPLNYLVPLGVPVSINTLDSADRSFIISMLAIALPFAWIGVAITVKRFRTIGWPDWLSLLFFVPIANIASFLLAAIWPEHAIDDDHKRFGVLRRIVPEDSFGAAALATVASAVLGLACVALGTRVLTSYGWGLFAAIPFSEGALAAFLYGAHRRRGLNESIAVALEGAICIAMAAPLALFLAFVGALFGHFVQNSGPRLRPNVSALIVLALLSPTIMGAEAVVPREASTYMVQSQVVMNAHPMQVWRHVISFPDLPPPTELVFRLGIAYPERAKIVGRGIGAVRYCEFSTGDFVEPITVWEPGKRLAFRVAHNPEPMLELSLYPTLDTPHLHGYMISRHGEFDLQPLPGGRTLLIGRTWYQHHLWPEAY